jgi:hypothetical protein
MYAGTVYYEEGERERERMEEWRAIARDDEFI